MSEYIPPGCAIDKEQVFLIKHSLRVSFSCCSTFNTFLHVMCRRFLFTTPLKMLSLAVTYLTIHNVVLRILNQSRGSNIRMRLVLKEVLVCFAASADKNKIGEKKGEIPTVAT